ncbi:hypothetical protein CAPTEDRAFT_202354 [Capitella teleta]|uniref:Major facilitator superfamily (MFS) profile domain-containing protein n=1 Tax=Capitella teleta TaxID=283909 RepID=R7TVK9_CAPTE|nr:hypothetical protein CAPTEDRAFT_202354 [Capitella teleta]|eukprot:ELT97622.1 hypothetical protein CAPTEDRAFT_202354 [Capitella teleta]
MEVDSTLKCEDSCLLSSESEEDVKHVKFSWKIIKTGIAIVILPPVLHDLSLKLDMTYTELSIASSMASVGAVFGAILGGVLTKKMGNYLDLIMVVVHLVNAAALLGVPFSDKVVAQSIEWWLQGMAMSVGFVVNNVVVVQLWTDKVGSAMLFLAAFGSLGNIFGPLLAVPFVSQVAGNDGFSPLVFYPFVILASLFVANAINLSIQYVVGLRCHRCYDSASIAEKKEDRKESKRPSQLLWLDNQQATGFIASETCFCIDMRSNMSCDDKHLALFLYLWGLTSVPAYFMIVIIMGMFTGPTATLLVVWCNEYITVDGYAMSVWQVAENVGILSSVLVGGIVFDVYGSLLVLLVNFIAGLIGCTAFLILQFAISTSCSSARHRRQILE